MRATKRKGGADLVFDGRDRSAIYPGLEVLIELKADQRSGTRTRGVVKAILTNAAHHPHGIKVRLEDGQVGRVKGLAEA
jgi:uncharacterized repeat protein (TIGR03833 family)